MLELHKSLTKILKESNIIAAEQLEGQKKMANNINFMATEEQKINISDNNFKRDIKAMLDEMSKDLKNTIRDVT